MHRAASRVLRILVFVLVGASVAVDAAAQAISASFASKGADIHYTVDGDGPPVILVHGFTGSGARHFGGTGVLQAIVNAGFRAAAIDCRGHGMSSKPTDPGAYGLRMVEDVVGLMDHLRIRRAHIIGYSMGGWIASQVLISHPERVLTVTLLGSGWEGEDVRGMNQQMLALADGFDRKDASSLMRGVTSGAGNGPSDADGAAENADLFARNPPEVLAAMARGMRPLFDIRGDQLKRVKVPVHALVGENDAPNLAGARRMSDVVPGMTVKIIPGATHQSSVRPSAPLIVEFLTQHREG